ncbi:MAG TPA: hypothetical protein VL485_17485 [Ktedonobacteraceae bacterium]|nr:hypothetical protein [Ktedonobacteraceae bacterium]
MQRNCARELAQPPQPSSGTVECNATVPANSHDAAGSAGGETCEQMSLRR